jgi:hypothetical protein
MIHQAMLLDYYMTADKLKAQKSYFASKIVVATPHIVGIGGVFRHITTTTTTTTTTITL